MVLAGLSPVGCAIAPVRNNLGSAGHTYPNEKKVIFPFISTSIVLPLLGLI